MKKLISASLCIVSIAYSMSAQTAPQTRAQKMAKQPAKEKKYVSSIDFLFGYELAANPYISALQTNGFTKLPMPAPSFALQFTGRMGPAIGFVAQFYHSYYPFEHDYNNYASIQNIKQYGIYLGPSLRFGTPDYLFEISALPGLTLVENNEFTLYNSPGYQDVQPNDQVVFTARGMVDFRARVYKRLALKAGVAFTYAEYDVKVDNDLPTFYNDRMTPFFGLVILAK